MRKTLLAIQFLRGGGNMNPSFDLNRNHLLTILVTALLLVLLLSEVSGQTLELESTPAWSSEQVNWTVSVALGDVDGDGDLDLVCGNNGSNTLYENVDGSLSPTPSWSSGPTNRTRSVALGDVDGDGDLDLVCGNDGSNTLYENVGGSLSTNPSWSSEVANNTSGISLGDVDGDGDLDLACDNYIDSNTLYENVGGSLSTTPIWSSDLIDRTDEVAWGDVDGDGDLDLVCGNGTNEGQSNTLYENVDGSLSPTPSWSSELANISHGVVLGDLDGDGDLDLVCANGYFEGQSNTLYENVDGSLSSSPSWSSGPANTTASVALGDLDGDGDLDLVCGNVGSNTLYENVDGSLSPVPIWSSGPENETGSVALGDMDGDGDLDLVCGNWGQSNTLYENVSGSFSPTPSWSSGLASDTYCLALGDVDGDGDPDLACGNTQSNTLYENVDSSLSPAPIWSSSQANDTRCVAWGDMDGDGDLDLVCGNDGQSNTIYENVSGSFSQEPRWTFGLNNSTRSVALGDMDGDGDLDVVCGNVGQANTLYENVDGSLSPAPSWSSGPANSTRSVALGDMDGDGDLDLVCGNYNQSDVLYENVDGSLSTASSWSSELANDTFCVALGDVDGDGDPDLACGSHYESDVLYENLGGSLSSTPSWSSGLITYTRSMAWGDVDGDGDLDLVCGNYWRSNSIYENLGGSLSPTPNWSSEPTNYTTSVALGDVDSDGDLDIVCGNGEHESQSNTLYSGFRAPVFKGSTADPLNQLANNGTHLRSVEISVLQPATDNLRRVDFQAFDVEADAFYLSPQFQFEGEAVWRSVDLADGSSLAGPFASSDEGVAGYFVWDTERLPADDRNVVLRLLVSEIPGRVSTVQHVAPYLKQLGPVEPSRPLAFVEAGELQFGIITVGDTTSVSITLENCGTEELDVSSVDFPSPEMTLIPALPFIVPPDASIELVVSLQPRTQLDASGEILIHTNDPLNPTVGLAVEAEILPLSFSSELLRVQDVIPLGEAATVVVQAAANVRLERGALFYRALGASIFKSLPVEPYEEGFLGFIPGIDVTESGLEYYIEMENSGVFATDPVGAPAEVYFQAVAAPTAVTSSPVPNAGAEFLQGQAVAVTTTLPLGSEFVEGSLYFRQGGQPAFQTTALEGIAPTLSASIPPDYSGVRGLEYFVQVQTMTETLTDPPVGPAESPHTITVSVLDLAAEQATSGGTYHMVSMPLDFGEGVHRDWEDLLSGQDVFGTYDPLRWRCFRYDPVGLAYAELDPDQDSDLFGLTPGKAFWLICREAYRLGIGSVSGYSTPTVEPYAITLAPGWNQVGQPYYFPVAWESVLIDGLSPAEAFELFDGPIPWSGSSYGDPATTLEPFAGYWIRNLSEDDLVLQVPPHEALDEAAKVAVDKGLGWTISVTARTALARDVSNTVGVHEAAKPQFDGFDTYEPPLSPGQAVSLYFPHGEWGRQPGSYTADFRPELEVTAGTEPWGHAYWFDVAKNYSADEGNEVTLTFSGLDAVPAAAVVSLVDHALDKTIDLSESAEYVFQLGKRDKVIRETDARFTLLVGSADFVSEILPGPPARTALYTNRPNPFNPSTVIRFDVAKPCHARLRIYDLSGALVRTLWDDHAEAGGYEVPWLGKDDRGRRLASGVYFYRLETGDGYQETRKLVMVQ